MARLLLNLLAAAALAAAGAAAAEAVRPEVGKPVQAALDLLKTKHGKEALAKLQEAEAVKDRTPFENYLLERVRGQALSLAGEHTAAAQALERAIASGQATGAEKQALLAAAAGQHYAAKSYQKAAETASRYLAEGGTEPALRTVLIQSLYLSGDLARAGKELQADLKADEEAGRRPPEERLQMLASILQRQQDNAGYQGVLEKLLTYYPKRDYWVTAVYTAAGQTAAADRLSLDLARLKVATGTMRSAGEYVEAAQLALQAGFPAEAKRFVDQGYAAGLLGSGPDADRHKRLKDLAAKNTAEDLKTVGQDDAKLASSKDGGWLHSTGLEYVLLGKADRGLELMEQGMKRGGIKHPEDARLRLAYAYQLANNKTKAIQVFKSVQGNDGAAALARLWAIHLQSAH